MKISIFGLGYVGAVTAGCLAKDGHDVIGVDIDTNKVDLINKGQTPIIEQDIGEIIKNAVSQGKLSATTDAVKAIANSDLSLVCVGTPSSRNGSLNIDYVRDVCHEIGQQIKQKNTFHTIVLRSTMLPGSMHDVVIPALEEATGMTVGRDFGLCNNPEFLRESTAVYDYFNPPKTVIGELQTDSKAGDQLQKIYATLDAPMIRTDIKSAEMVKYTDNTWHALKVAFANEIGNVCKDLEIDSHNVMEIFCQDTKLNLSPYYLKPGFAFGGSCLPKDIRALTYLAKRRDIDTPVLSSLLSSNDYQIDRAIELIERHKTRKIGILGFAFKAGTDDMRESPVVTLIEYLIGKGYDLKLYDKNVNLSSLVGSNRDYLMRAIPHIFELLETDINTVLEHSDLIIIGNKDPDFSDILIPNSSNYKILDLVRIHPKARSNALYEGICW